jgi:hypothetical protein
MIPNSLFGRFSIISVSSMSKGRNQRSHLLLLPNAENGLVAETLSPAAVFLWQRHPLVAGLLFSDAGALGIE